MNSIKTVFSVLGMAAAAYIVYVAINGPGRPARETDSLAEATSPWSETPSVEGSTGGAAPSDEGPPSEPAARNLRPGPPGSPPPGSEPAATPPFATLGSPEAASAGWGMLDPPLDSDESDTYKGGVPAAPAGHYAHEHDPSVRFEDLMAAVQEKLAAEQLDEVLVALTPLRGSSRLAPEEAAAVEELLSQLAGTVIYSREHWLEPPYVVRAGDTLEGIARRHDVPAELLAKVNGIRDPDRLEPGRELKVVRGPFEAVVDLAQHELILLLDGRYAGFFPIGIGLDLADAEGVFYVRDKRVDPSFYDADGRLDPTDPLGNRWIELDDELGIHGTNNPQIIGAVGGRGCISLGDQDVEDVFDILSIGSRVTLHR